MQAKETRVSKIGFIGASGLMGHVMGHGVHRNRERVADLLAAGVAEAASPAALAAGSEIVFRCVTGSPQAEATVLGASSLSVAADFVTRGVRCNAICPGTVASPSLRDRISAQAAACGHPCSRHHQDINA